MNERSVVIDHFVHGYGLWRHFIDQFVYDYGLACPIVYIT